ncbi:HlyD family type I secretion periplasmic adaptor subunit [Vibrio hangzhouensis]|uniref:HlyD family type I secretion periplasmic adaptor subunit n=1 Tax=Vibrio hangzhouensis TaxID=462991 RepID=UPI001C98078F|nr:HlyD family type I secretion periplasmic adaptor subunit [Vibrio hangzhouensis]MBY6196825.1 HlyD family type I secretion periplasmic adaptor subunit [Vibrio hangzhouensis]
MSKPQYAEAIETKQTKRLLSISTYAIAFCVVAFGVWSVVTQVDEIAKAQGKVVPEGERQIIQSDIGGKLKAISVSQGEMVEAGQVLVEFDATFQTTALEELKAQQATLNLTIERLSSLIDERDPDFSAYEQQYPELVAEQRAQRSAQVALYYQKRIVLEKEAEQIAEQLRSTDNAIPAFERQLTASRQELAILQKGQKSGNISRLRVLEMQQKVASIEQQIEQARGKKALLLKQADSNDEKISQLLAEAKVEVADQRSKAASELSALEARVRSGEAKLSNTVLTSPLQGLVQSIPSTKVGAVIQPGGTVVEIVPIGGVADFKAKLSPRDIGFVTAGQPARVKIDAYDYSRFGALSGVVESISPTTIQDEKGNIFYEVTIAVDTPYFRNDPEKFAILPGMTGEVDITTGEKTVFQYLWKPIYTNISRAFGER